jgi:Glycosyl hydrolase family 67 C-terminus
LPYDRALMSRARVAAVVLAAGIALGIGVATALNHALRLQVDEAVGDAGVHSPVAVTPRGARALPLRWVDMGGVGIPADGGRWGWDYLHDTRAFHDFILAEPPYVKEAEFRRVAQDWERYLDRMAGYGNNGVVVPAFLELVNFDRLDGGSAVYADGSPYRGRHRVLRERFTELFRAARARGFTVLLKTDMVALTEPLERYLRSRPEGMDPHAPGFWRAYGAAFDELFATTPEVGGVVIRVGEAGRLFSSPGWPYWSRFEVKDPQALRTMLRELLPVFEAHHRLLVLRTWSVGPGTLGGLHTDPATYDAALGGIESESLVVSTKYLQGDFFSFLPPNPTLARGAHRRIVEFQARREFEGFGAFPNYMAVPHQQALQAALARNPHVAGTWIWTQDGGPLRAGPRSLYPLHGSWAWIDANVYATSRLASDPGVDADAVARDWVARTLSADPEVVEAVSGILLRSREAVERGFYVRPFAERRVRLGAVDVPPLLWIMEWDQVGGWSAALGTMYRVAGDPARAVDEGFEAVHIVAESRRALERIEGRLTDRRAAYLEMHASLAYEESLLAALAHYRRTVLGLYAWLDTGEDAARQHWRRGLEEYRSARIRHQAAYGGRLDLPAFDFSPADAALAMADDTGRLAWLSRAQVAVLALLYLLGSGAVRLPAVFPGRALARVLWSHATLSPVRDDVASRHSWSAVLLLAAASAIAVATVSSFVSWRLAAFPVLALAALAAGLWLGWARATRVTPAAAAAAASPLLLPTALLAGAMSVRGPLHFWFLFWTAPHFRGAFVTLLVVLVVWAAAAIVASGRARTGSIRAAWGGALTSLGAVLLATSAVLPGTETLLHALHQPLALLPTTFAVAIGIVTYLGVPQSLSPALAVGGAVLVVSGLAVARARRAVGRG